MVDKAHSTSDQDARDNDLVVAHDVRRRRILAMTPAERFRLMDDLCREVTWLAVNARRR